MTMFSKLNKIETALVTLASDVDDKIYHYFRPQLEAPYIVWQEDSEASSLEADVHKQEQAISGTVDFYTKTEYDPIVDKIQEALNTVETCAWALNSVQYEDETDLIHYEWTWNVG